jgi:hypothetical protein
MQRTSKNPDIVVFHSSCVPSSKKAIFCKCILGYLEILSTVSDSYPALKFKNELHHTTLVNFRTEDGIYQANTGFKQCKDFCRVFCGTYVVLEGQDMYNPQPFLYLWLLPIFTEHSGTLDIEFPNTCLICSNSHLQLPSPTPSINSRTLGKISLTIDPLHSHTNAA